MMVLRGIGRGGRFNGTLLKMKVCDSNIVEIEEEINGLGVSIVMFWNGELRFWSAGNK